MKMFVGFVLFAAFALHAAFADVITLQAYEELVNNGAAANGMTKAVISNPVLEEALLSYSKNRLGSLLLCGQLCVGGSCYTPGCTCEWPICVGRNSLETTKSVNPIQTTLETQKLNHQLEEALVAFAKKGNLGGLPICGETCVGGTCNTPGCSCSWPVCTKNSLAM